ncbi:MAG TPA: 2-oxoglutarate dehydrogenase E1 component [Verrucomicrobiae bacterium]|nr:2-oxoglutarate dehydrogenase E1 component [Verrucomicrobiae bacterium]
MPDEKSIADAYRRWGYLQADLDGLGRLPPITHPDIEEAGKGKGAAAAAERYRAIYAGPIGVEFMHLRRREVAEWVAARMEREPRVPDRPAILRRLAQAELLEQFMHRRWVGSKRYSLEGSASVLVAIDNVLDEAASAEVALIAMSHRGRLNVVVNVVGRAPGEVFARFEEGDPRAFLGGGDVRYHLGATGEYRTPAGRVLRLHLVSNPSHLEAVDPVMMGRARARQDRIGPEGREKVLPICLHGDAAFAGQGIVAETLNLDLLPGYQIGGTVHIIVNNLIGFTTAHGALHGARFSSDAAHRLDVPIFHVNGLEPEAVARVGRIAAEYREAFRTDVVVDVIGFRRYGHSEVDDPTVTQPILYRRIEKTPMLWQAYGERIGAGAETMKQVEADILAGYAAARDNSEKRKAVPMMRTLPAYWNDYVGGAYDRRLEVPTAVPLARLREIAARLTDVPAGFNLNPKVRKGIEQRAEMAAGKRLVDWGMAEALAFGSLLLEGTPVRLSGQDSRRGTFNQRHSAWIDFETGADHLPLQHLAEGQARFQAYDSPLSEGSVLGFEYGYSRDTPEALVLWEAQFGDFANGAQVVLDQFISAAEDKWNLWSGIVLLLPHGYEGQGPEHSSARLERFLQLCAEDNIQVCQPANAGQYFHLLRRQALRRWRKPLVVMTPKSLLRADSSAAPFAALSDGGFQPVLGDPRAAQAEKLLICSGKVAHDLRAWRDKKKADRVAIVTLEQFYPFPDKELREALLPFGGNGEIVWVQEEPANMGAESFVRRRIQQVIGDARLSTVHRSASASPATGSTDSHKLEQETLLSLACVVT